MREIERTRPPQGTDDQHTTSQESHILRVSPFSNSGNLSIGIRRSTSILKPLLAPHEPQIDVPRHDKLTRGSRVSLAIGQVVD
ncbi:hypothetical protein R1flu_023769 [Riccia fluitans]|uniref:Uncharacterized protein n=1 Tax=Riccia fluitans TaxID=41844 RepID=A0ABD1XT01_9MARC